MQQVTFTPEIWSFQRRLSRRLLGWALPNVLLGALVGLRTRRPLVRALALQAAVWGAINAAIAIVGGRAAERKQARAAAAIEVAQARSLRRLLWLNAGLDVGYLLFGGWLARRPGAPSRRGHGVGILLQAAFLLLFDVFHARAAPSLREPTP